jgi:peptidyl-prolyl cis-trans isomerase A (cyclophilin A)
MALRFAPLTAPFLLALTATAAMAQPAPAPAARPDVVHVAIRTEAGTITLALDARNAPVTTANFLRYADQKRFDGTVFYRSMRLAWGEQPNGLIQGGTQGEPKRVLKPIAHEPTDKTGIKHEPGTISMARYAPGTATGDFSILLSKLEGLDANPAAADAEGRAGFAAFGRVVEGMDVVRNIYEAPLSPTAGAGALKGQMLVKPVKILTVRRTPAPAPVTTTVSAPAP